MYSRESGALRLIATHGRQDPHRAGTQSARQAAGRIDLARGTPFGTMRRNRAAHPCIRLLGKGALCYAQPPGPVGILLYVLSTGDIRAQGEGFEPSRANATLQLGLLRYGPKQKL